MPKCKNCKREMKTSKGSKHQRVCAKCWRKTGMFLELLDIFW